MPGVRVVVPFGRGNRRTEGLLIQVEEGEEASGLKALETVLDREPVLDETMLRLAAFRGNGTSARFLTGSRPCSRRDCGSMPGTRWS